MDWREVKDEKEKYAAYLCSREWAVLKENADDERGVMAIEGALIHINQQLPFNYLGYRPLARHYKPGEYDVIVKHFATSLIDESKWLNPPQEEDEPA